MHVKKVRRIFSITHLIFETTTYYVSCSSVEFAQDLQSVHLKLHHGPSLYKKHPDLRVAHISGITPGPNWQRVSIREGTGDAEDGPIYAATQHFHIDLLCPQPESSVSLILTNHEKLPNRKIFLLKRGPACQN